MKAQPLTPEEAKKLLDACPDTTTGIRDRALFATLYRGAMRISATLRIKPGDIDWGHKLITIQRDKGGKGRTVPMDGQALDILRIWMERRTTFGINGHHPVFCATEGEARGNELDASQCRKRIKLLGKKAGIEKRCHLHGLRHTGASVMYEEGIPIATISRILGHASIATTARYLHDIRPDLMDERLKERVW